MKKLTIEIQNLSPLVLSSGSGVGTIIDSDIEWDKNDLPYFPAKRLKGLLRESAIEAKEMFDSSGLSKTFDISNVEKIFGGNDEESKLKIYNLYLKNIDGISKGLSHFKAKYKDIFTSEKIKNAITQIRQQTAIDDSGIAKDNSLRTLRALNPGFSFRGGIILVSDEEGALNLLVLACKNLRYAGLNRNRGFGEIEVKLYEGQNEITKEIMKKLEGVANV